MTLIARIRFRGIPLYVSDLLLSREGTSANKVHLPAGEDINAKLPPSSPRSISGMRQKLSLIGDRLVIAWAGNLGQARAMIREIADEVVHGVSSYEEVREIIERVPFQDRNDLSLIGTIVTPDPKNPEGIHLSHFSYGAETYSDGDIEIEAAGTGANDIFEAVPQIIRAGRPPNCDREDNEYFAWVLKQGLGLICQFVGHDSATGQNLLDWWGGAFEFAMLDRGRFRKISNILHSSWRASRVRNKKEFRLELISKFMKYDYADDALIVQTLELSNEAPDRRAKVKEHGYWVYTPLLRSKADYDFSNFMERAPSFEHETISCFVFIDPAISDIGHLTYVHHDPNGDKSLEIERFHEPDRFQIRLQPQLWLELEAAISSATGYSVNRSAAH